MSVFCLIHGSTQSPAGWGPLISELETRGHSCLSVDLPIDEPELSAIRYADVIGAALAGVEAPVVVAHSASGLFLPLVPARAGVERLVFLAAVIPRIGQSFAEQYRRAPDMYWPDFVGKNPVQDPALALHFLFHDCEPERAAWALSTLRLMNACQALLEVCPLEGWPAVSVSYISCTEDRTLRPEWWEAVARERLGVEPIRMCAGHAPHVSRPAELAKS